MKMRFSKMYEDVKAPTRGTPGSAGLDIYVYSPDAVIGIRPHETAIVHTGLIFEVPEGYFAGIYARSGLSTKRGLRPANCVGVIDSDYRGEVLIGFHNDSDETQIIYNGDRVAQAIIQPFIRVELEEAETLTKTTRGDGGFGSTGE